MEAASDEIFKQQLLGRGGGGVINCQSVDVPRNPGFLAFFTASPDTEVSSGQPGSFALLGVDRRCCGSQLSDDERVLQGREEVLAGNLFEDAAVAHSSPHFG